MKVAIASGKGGTGKTTVAVNLARAWGAPVQLLDCDVEEPNAHLFLGGEPGEEIPVFIRIPSVDEALCDACGECGRFCEFHAIVVVGKAPIVFPGMCHACGGCAKVCPRGAIREIDARIGVIETRLSDTVSLTLGRLDVGVSMAPPLVHAVRARIQEGSPAILDAPAGTSCTVVATLRETDFVVLVTEPTPFGLHDLTLAVDLVRELRLPFGVVVNRVGVGDDRVHAWCRKERIEILLEIPDDRRIAEGYARGRLLIEALPEYAGLFRSLADSIQVRAGVAA